MIAGRLCLDGVPVDLNPSRQPTTCKESAILGLDIVVHRHYGSNSPVCQTAQQSAPP